MPNIIPSQAQLAAANSYEEKIGIFYTAAEQIATDMQNHKSSKDTFNFDKFSDLREEITNNNQLANKSALLTDIQSIYRIIESYHPKLHKLSVKIGSQIEKLGTFGFLNTSANNNADNNPRRKRLDFDAVQESNKENIFEMKN